MNESVRGQDSISGPAARDEEEGLWRNPGLGAVYTAGMLSLSRRERLHVIISFQALSMSGFGVDDAFESDKPGF